MSKSKKKQWKAALTEGFHPIMIDVEVHKAIEGARQSFTEMPNTILRRMLDIDPGGAVLPAGGEAPRPRRAKGGGASDGGWSKLDRRGRDVFLPEGTELRAAYGGQTVTGTISQGAWQIGSARFNSPSAALIANVRTRAGQPVNLNGWRHWEVKLPDSPTWRPLLEV